MPDRAPPPAPCASHGAQRQSTIATETFFGLGPNEVVHRSDGLLQQPIQRNHILGAFGKNMPDRPGTNDTPARLLGSITTALQQISSALSDTREQGKAIGVATAMQIRHLALAIESLGATVQRMYAITHQNLTALGDVAEILRQARQATQPGMTATFCRPPTLNAAQPFSGEAKNCGADARLDAPSAEVSAAFDRPLPSTVVCWFGIKCRHFAQGKGHCRYLHPSGTGCGAYVLHPSQRSEHQPSCMPASLEMPSKHLCTTGLQTHSASESSGAKIPATPATTVPPGGNPIASGSSHWFKVNSAWLRDPGNFAAGNEVSISSLPGHKDTLASPQSGEGSKTEGTDSLVLDPGKETIEPHLSDNAIHASFGLIASPDRQSEAEDDSDDATQTSQEEESDEEHPLCRAMARLCTADRLRLEQLLTTVDPRFTVIGGAENCDECTQVAYIENDRHRMFCIDCVLAQTHPEGNAGSPAGDLDVVGEPSQTQLSNEDPLRGHCPTSTQLIPQVVVEIARQDLVPTTALAASCADTSDGALTSDPFYTNCSADANAAAHVGSSFSFVTGNGVLILGLTSVAGKKN